MAVDIKKNEIKQIVEVLQKTSKTTDDLLDEVADIYLQFTVKKVPKVTNKTIKIKLPHGLYRKNTEVCLFVKDLDRKNREFEVTQDHFKDLLTSKGVKCINEVIPLKALKLEYKPYEAKRNLSQNYDLYLADDRIIRLLPSLLGKSFYGRKRNPVQVNLKATDLQKEINSAINNTRCIMRGSGPVSMVRVAHFGQKTVQIAENILSTVNQLSAAIPGGSVNIRNIYIKTQDSMALPLYVSVGSNDEVTFPEQERKDQEIVMDEVTTVEKGKVVVTPTGFVSVVKDSENGIKKLFQGKRKRKRLQSKPKKIKSEKKT